MIFYIKYFLPKYLLLFLIFTFYNSPNAFPESNDTIPLGQHLKKEGFTPVLSLSTGMQHLVGYGDFGVSARLFIPMPFGFRLVGDYTNFFINHVYWGKESHVGIAVQYPIFSHGRISFYSSLGANLVIDETLMDHKSTYSGHTFKKGVDYYYDPQFGLGFEIKLNKIFHVYNEWTMINEWGLKTMLGFRVNFMDLSKIP